MKKLTDILDKGFELFCTYEDGTKQYDVKLNCSVMFDYFHVNSVTVYPDGKINATIGVNCDLLEGIQNELDEFHVYELRELI